VMALWCALLVAAVELPPEFANAEAAGAVQLVKLPANPAVAVGKCDADDTVDGDAWVNALADSCCDATFSSGALPHTDAVVSVKASRSVMADLSSEIAKVDAHARITLLISASGEDTVPTIPASLLTDARVVHAFVASPNADASGSDPKMTILSPTSSGAESVRSRIQARESSCDPQFSSALERVWGTHEAALLQADPTGQRLAAYYTMPGSNLSYVVHRHGPRHFFSYYRSIPAASGVYCQRELSSLVPAGAGLTYAYRCYVRRSTYWAWRPAGIFLWLLIFVLIFGLCFYGHRRYYRYSYDEV